MLRAAEVHDSPDLHARPHGMKPTLGDLIGSLIARLRGHGLAVSVAEAMDAARATSVVGVQRRVFRDALAATLVKDERDRGTFLEAFDRVFPAQVPARRAAEEPRRGARGGAGESGGSGSAGGATGTAARPSSRAPSATESGGDDAGESEGTESEHAEDDGRRERVGDGDADAAGAIGGAADDAADGAADDTADGAADDAAGGGALRRDAERRLRDLPFRAMTPIEVDACADLTRAIAARVTARVRRRLAPRPSGRLDFRRTIRAAVPRGGVPFERRYRGRRPGAPDLVAVVDLSMSTATASEFFLALVAPAARYFRHVHLFGFVDRLVPIEFTDGQVRPAGPLDVMARSDFGRVLRDLVEDHVTILGADTVLLVLGDARNNRRPPRADLLAKARARVRRVLWLNPEPRERWNTGDSVIASYARHVESVVACANLAELERALVAVERL